MHTLYTFAPPRNLRLKEKQELLPFQHVKDCGTHCSKHSRGQTESDAQFRLCSSQALHVNGRDRHSQRKHVAHLQWVLAAEAMVFSRTDAVGASRYITLRCCDATGLQQATCQLPRMRNPSSLAGIRAKRQDLKVMELQSPNWRHLVREAIRRRTAGPNSSWNQDVSSQHCILLVNLIVEYLGTQGRLQCVQGQGLRK